MQPHEPFFFQCRRVVGSLFHLCQMLRFCCVLVLCMALPFMSPQIAALFPNVALPLLPPASNALSQEYLERRRVALEAYLHAVFSMHECRPRLCAPMVRVLPKGLQAIMKERDSARLKIPALEQVAKADPVPVVFAFDQVELCLFIQVRHSLLLSSVGLFLHVLPLICVHTSHVQFSCIFSGMSDFVPTDV